MKKYIFAIFFLTVIFFAVLLSYRALRYFNENKLLQQVILNLEADSRIAEVFVSNVENGPQENKPLTTIKFLEYDTRGKALTPRYFTFSGNIIQFQSLVIRFNDVFIKQNDRLRGKSAYLFWKVFMLDGANTQEFAITEAGSIPQGYKLKNGDDAFEKNLWENFWKYALNNKDAIKMGIKNAQIEAPGTMFVPGALYTLKIEHDGGIRIDTQPIPEILKGEHVPQ